MLKTLTSKVVVAAIITGTATVIAAWVQRSGSAEIAPPVASNAATQTVTVNPTISVNPTIQLLSPQSQSGSANPAASLAASEQALAPKTAGHTIVPSASLPEVDQGQNATSAMQAAVGQWTGTLVRRGSKEAHHWTLNLQKSGVNVVGTLETPTYYNTIYIVEGRTLNPDEADVDRVAPWNEIRGVTQSTSGVRLMLKIVGVQRSSTKQHLLDTWCLAIVGPGNVVRGVRFGKKWAPRGDFVLHRVRN